MNRILLCFAFLACSQAIAFGQSRHEKFRRSVDERSMEELLKAIDSYDGGGYELVTVRGLLPSGFESQSIFKQVLQDPRVRKIYSELAEMPKKEAASIGSTSFNESWLKFKSLAEKGGLSPTRNYGLHAKLWLSFKFESKEKFNSKFRTWHNWYVDRLADESYYDASKMYKSMQKKFYESNGGPELLMYLNLVMIDQSSGDLNEFEKLLQKSGYGLALSNTVATYDFFALNATKDSEPLVKIPLLRSWGGLDTLGTERRAMLVSRAQKFVDPKDPVSKAVSDLADRFLDENGLFKMEDLLRGDESEKTVLQLKFIGSESKSFLAQGWNRMIPPTKERVLKTVERMYKKTPKSERPDWDPNVQAIRSWLSEIPDSGIKVKGKKSWEWPEPDKDGEKPKLRIRLVIENYHAFDETGNAAKNDRPANKPSVPAPKSQSPTDKNERIEKNERKQGPDISSDDQWKSTQRG